MNPDLSAMLLLDLLRQPVTVRSRAAAPAWTVACLFAPLGPETAELRKLGQSPLLDGSLLLAIFRSAASDAVRLRILGSLAGTLVDAKSFRLMCRELLSTDSRKQRLSSIAFAVTNHLHVQPKSARILRDVVRYLSKTPLESAVDLMLRGWIAPIRKSDVQVMIDTLRARSPDRRVGACAAIQIAVRHAATVRDRKLVATMAEPALASAIKREKDADARLGMHNAMRIIAGKKPAVRPLRPK